MSQTIEEYLATLKELMKNCDAAIQRDALADAEEHLRSAMEGEDPSRLETVMEEYGSPEEIAAAYEIMEEKTTPGIASSRLKKDRNWLARFFGIYADSRAWGAVLYMLISIVTGTVYFSWAVTGISLSVSMIIMIFGIPLAALIFVSFRGLALLEGRIVEALLGVRMPRRPVFTRKDVTWQQKLKSIFGSKVTWFSLLYLLLDFPLGILYFCLTVTFFALGLGLIAIPVVQYFFHIPMIDWNGHAVYLATWTYLLILLAGFLVLTANMHLAKGLGWLQGKLARGLLVVD